MKLPENIEKILEGKEYKTDSIGKSDSQVMIFDDPVLKIARYSSENQEKVQMFRWIAGIHPESLFEHLEIEPDWDKIRYFILLDELF
ncbi:MAG: hypothetical protein IK078_12635 [Lachnospiraceae bacterium]|nr:hypothetical protein [Lachnospiraceae bacterium]